MFLQTTQLPQSPAFEIASRSVYLPMGAEFGNELRLALLIRGFMEFPQFSTVWVPRERLNAVQKAEPKWPNVFLMISNEPFLESLQSTVENGSFDFDGSIPAPIKCNQHSSPRPHFASSHSSCGIKARFFFGPSWESSWGWDHDDTNVHSSFSAIAFQSFWWNFRKCYVSWSCDTT